jgi:hypothetical protein
MFRGLEMVGYTLRFLGSLAGCGSSKGKPVQQASGWMVTTARVKALWRQLSSVAYFWGLGRMSRAEYRNFMVRGPPVV